jgi:hypothetical protein
MIRSILAVLLGIVTLTVVSFAIEAAADPLLTHMFPVALPDAKALAGNVAARVFMLVYTMFSIAAGGYVTAWIARRSPVTHAAIMGAIEVAFILYVMIAAPFAEVVKAPMWLSVASIILTIPAAFLGGALRARQAGRTVKIPAGTS